MATWVKEIKCGCGECRFHKPADGICPKGTSKDAVWLYSQVYNHDEPETEEEVDQDLSVSD